MTKAHKLVDSGKTPRLSAALEPVLPQLISVPSSSSIGRAAAVLSPNNRLYIFRRACDVPTYGIKGGFIFL